MTKNETKSLLLQAANAKNYSSRRPIWLMRQAGRILKEYRDVRASAGSFLKLVKTPELAAEVTLQPVNILGVDAAIIFSDILVIPEAMGFPYRMIEKTGPYFDNGIESEKDVNKIISTSEQDLSYVYEAIKLTKKNLPNDIPLIGFAGAPWTIFCYLIEKMGSKTFSKARKMIQQHPSLSHTILQRITDATITYLKNQCLAGADAIQLFDSWAGVLDQLTYKTFGLDYNRQILESLQWQNVPRILFTRGAYNSIASLKNYPVEVIQLEWQTDIKYAVSHLNETQALQGNLDPAVLYADFKVIKARVIEMLKAFPKHRHIVNLGHGVYPDINPDNVRCFIETVKEYGEN